jgi:hypothetical protein
MFNIICGFVIILIMSRPSLEASSQTCLLGYSDPAVVVPLSGVWKDYKLLSVSYLSSGSLAESATCGGVSSSVLESGVVDVGKLVLSDHGGSLGELAGLQLHLGVVESRNHEDVVGGEDGLG